MKRNVMRYFKYVFLLAAIGTITGFYFYNEPVKSTASKNADLIIQANDFGTICAKAQHRIPGGIRPVRAALRPRGLFFGKGA